MELIQEQQAKRFRMVRDALGISRKDFGARLSLSHEQVKSKELGRSSISPQDIRLLFLEYGTDRDFITEGTGNVFTQEKAYNNFQTTTAEPETKMVRQYRTLADLDEDILKEIQLWINDMEKYSPGFKGWFRIEFQNRFPEFDDWKSKQLKKEK